MRSVKQKFSRSLPGEPSAELPLSWEPTLEQISLRAREICLARGGEEGVDIADWLQAEQELKRDCKN